ncbi:DUF4360 domain-containing protein [Krasilnikovia sp. MM14-A1004]|uniref:DUF4360 domain-containing protein n=1 Tax=Krasilnikovia sp. MM14-A1004 TaxID=3373541 RepID=UPI00399D3C1F
MTFRQAGARLLTLATAIALTTLSLPSPAQAEDSVPPGGQVTLDVQTVNGSGCPAGTAWVSMQPDNTGFRIYYSNFRASDGGSSNPTDIRKNCQVNLLVHIPQGFTYAIARADYWGRAHLEPGATALERTNYYLQGSSDNNYADHYFAGPFNGGWHTVDITSAASLVWAPCGVTRSLNVNTELRVDAGSSSATSSISLRASEGDVYTLVNFQWRQC